MNLNKRNNMMFKFFISLLIGVIVLPISITQAAQNGESLAQGENVRIFFSPAKVTLPPDTTLSLMLDAHSDQIGFVRIDLAFDPFKIQLSDEIQPTDLLRTVIQKTSMSSANSTGQITIILGIAPGDPMPTGILNVAQIPIHTVTTLTKNTSISVIEQKVEIVDRNATDRPFTSETASIIINPAQDTTGVFRPINGILFLKNTHNSGFADIGLNYGIPGDYPVVGDWDGNGTVTIGVYRNGSFFLRNENTIGFAEVVFTFGQPGDQPVAGDWDGDGIDTIGVYRPSNGQFMLRNSNDAGAADISFYLGNVGDVGIAGDWDGDGLDTTGVFRPVNGIIFLKNANDTGFADVGLNYGIPGDKPVIGDWDGDGDDTIGVYRNGRFFLRNSNDIGFADIVFDLGNPGDIPIAGNWDGLP